MASWLDGVHDGAREIREIAYDLQGLAASFSNTGNDVVADRLRRAALDLEAAQKSMIDAISGNLRDEVRKSMDGIGITIGALLQAGASEVSKKG